MDWPYQFVDLDKAQKRARRHALDRYAFVAQLSTLVPVALFLIYRLTRWTIRRVKASIHRAYDAVPASPGQKRRRLSVVGSMNANARKFFWWLGDDFVFSGWNMGPRDEIIAGLVWTAWLLVLSVVDTGNGELVEDWSNHHDEQH